MARGRSHLIPTKFVPPAARPETVPRSRLVRLVRGGAAKLVVLSAPAGFGKSTLLAECVRAAIADGIAVGWLSLDRDDDDLGRFLAYLCAAFQRADAGVGAAAAGLLRSSPVAPVDAVIELLVEDLAAHAGRLALVLDDYHLVQRPEIHDAVARLIAYAPPGFRLVIASREEPPLPLGRMRVAGEVVEVTAAELRFDLAEAEAFLNGGHGLGLAVDDVALLVQRTEGWAAGLQLASLALERRTERRAFLDSFSGYDRGIVDFLTSDVLLRQPQEVQNFLLHTAVLERFDAALCDHVTGQGNGHAMLERLDAANLFLVPLDNERRWFRYHHLFAEFLRGRLDRVHPGLARTLHARAAEWHSRHGNLSDAVNHALAAGDDAGAAQLVEDCAMELIRQGDLLQPSEWLNRLPPAVVESRPRLNLIAAWIFFQMMQPRRAGRHLIAARRALTADLSAQDAGPSGALVAEMRTLAAGVLSGADRSRFARDLALRWLDGLPADQPFLRGTLANILAFSHYSMGDLGASRIAGERGRQEHERARSVLGVVYADLLLGLAEKSRGRLTEGERLLRRGQQLARERLGTPSYAEALVAVFLAEIAYERNELDLAETLLRDNQFIIEGGGLVVHAQAGTIHLARLRAVGGDGAGALEILAKAERLGRERRYRRLRASTLNEQVRLLLAAGERHAAREALLRNGIDPAGDAGTAPAGSPGVELEHMALSRVLIADGHADRAVGLLDRLAVGIERQGRLRRLLQVLALRSVALAALGRRGRALDTLRRALALGESEGFLRSFIDEGTQLKPLLNALLKEGTGDTVSAGYLRRLLHAFGGPETRRAVPPAAEPVGILLEPLSGRELDVLHLLAAGCSNEEVARRLSLAPSTVKWHLRNVFDKLGVRSRTQAVIAAQQLGLLSR